MSKESPRAPFDGLRMLAPGKPRVDNFTAKSNAVALFGSWVMGEILCFAGGFSDAGARESSGGWRARD
jgi:hypothetical protein